MLCKSKAMSQRIGREKGHVIPEMGESSVSLCAQSGSCLWCSPELGPTRRDTSCRCSFGFLKGIHLGSRECSQLHHSVNK